MIKFAFQRNKPTAEILQQLIVRDYENFNLIPVQTFKNTTPSNHEMFIQDFPFHVYMHEVPSDFVEVIETNIKIKGWQGAEG